MNFKHKNGFTLIELLVVIAIIALLSSVVFASISSARTKARDARRKMDLKQIHTALEMLYIDTNSYIDTNEICSDFSTGCSGCGCGGETAHDYGNWSPSDSNLYKALVPDYMSVLPIDPVNTAAHYYMFEPNCGSQGNCSAPNMSICCEYVLRVQLESGGNWYDDSFGTGIR